MAVKPVNIILIIFEVIIIILYSQFVRYETTDPPLRGVPIKTKQKIIVESVDTTAKPSDLLNLVYQLAPVNNPPAVVKFNMTKDKMSDLGTRGLKEDAATNLNRTKRRDIKILTESPEEVIQMLSSTADTRQKRSGAAKQEPSQYDPNNNYDIYPMFIDVHIMIIVGFGFLMTFLKKYSYSSVGFNLLLCGIMIQWAILCQGIFNTEDSHILIGTKTLLSSDIAVASVLISFGAILGKTSSTQLVVMSIIEMVLFACNEHLAYHTFHAADIGGSIVVHAFGAYFGLAVSLMLYQKDLNREKEGASYQSDVFAMVGTLFLWIMWPSFNMGLASPGDNQRRAMINTYLALAASVATTYALSSLVEKEGKLDMVHVQNSTLAGGVLMGAIANAMIHPFGAVIVGSIAGAVSVLGYKYLQGLFYKRLRLHDTCGVQFLHGIPGVLSGLFSIVVAALANEDVYGYSLYDVYPARVPEADSPEYQEIIGHMPHFEPGSNRSSGMQASYQALTLGVTLLIAIGGGLITGFILKLKIFEPIEESEAFEDKLYWEVPHLDVEQQAGDEVIVISDAGLRTNQFHLQNAPSPRSSRPR